MSEYDWVIVGKGSTALNFLYGKYFAYEQNNSSDNFKNNSILLIGEDDLVSWEPFGSPQISQSVE